MKTSHDMLEDQLEQDEEQLGGIKSYLKELKDMTAKHDTPKDQFEEDLTEAEHNVKYYEGEIAQIKKELGGQTKDECAYPVTDTILPHTAKQGIGFFILSSVTFVAGTLLGFRLSSQRGSKDRREEKEER